MILQYKVLEVGGHTLCCYFLCFIFLFCFFIFFFSLLWSTFFHSVLVYLLNLVDCFISLFLFKYWCHILRMHKGVYFTSLNPIHPSYNMQLLKIISFSFLVIPSLWLLLSMSSLYCYILLFNKLNKELFSTNTSTYKKKDFVFKNDNIFHYFFGSHLLKNLHSSTQSKARISKAFVLLMLLLCSCFALFMALMTQ